MKIQVVLPVLAGLLTILSSWMLAMSGQSYALAMIATIIGVSGIVLNDLKHKVTLSNFYTNLAAVCTLLIVLARMEKFSGDELLLAMADVLIYLQLVLIWKRKSSRDYWLILLSNMLEVAVSSALNLNYLFSMYMAIYSVMGIFAMGLLLMHREYERYSPSPAGAGGETTSRSGRWPLLQQSSAFRVHTPTVEINATLGRDFTRRMAHIIGWTFALTLLLFIAIPRVGQTALRTSFTSTRIVGFSEDISLGELGQLAERHDRVMQVHLLDPETEKPLTLLDAPLWQGGTLVDYEKGNWSRLAKNGNSPRLASRGELDNATGLVLQRITIEPTDSSVVWCVFPPVTTGTKSPVDFDDARDQVSSRDSLRRRRVSVEMLTAGIINRRQASIIPHRGPLPTNFRDRMLALPKLVDGVDPLTNLKRIAQETVASIPANDPVRRAKALELYMSDPSRFRYSLVAPERDSQLDPIEDFLTKNPEGHCEYFASALALMLRSVGIPSRVVVGFKGGEVDAITSAYVVQQSDAHSWVEAYLDDTNVPESSQSSLLWKSVPGAAGAWLRLDPTPYTANTEATQQNVFWYMYRQATLYARAVWANYVIGMDSTRQREVIYQPIVQALNSLTHREAWSNLAANVAGGISQLLSNMADGDAHAWFQLLFLLCLTFLLVMLVKKPTLKIVAAIERWRTRQKSKQAATVEVVFYRKLEAVLSRAGLKRRQHQTPREFAFEVGGELSDRSETVAVAGVPRRLVEAFYRVRYGGRPLDSDEARSVEQALAQLAESLQRRRGIKSR